MRRKIHKQGATAMIMRICGDRLYPCYCKQTGECFKALEVTEEVLKMGLICIAEEQAPADKEGMAEVTFIDMGDFIVITHKGVRRFCRDDFQRNYSF